MGPLAENARVTLNTTKSRMKTDLELRPPLYCASLEWHAKSWPTPTYGSIRYLESYRIIAILGTRDRGLGGKGPNKPSRKLVLGRRMLHGESPDAPFSRPKLARPVSWGRGRSRAPWPTCIAAPDCCSRRSLACASAAASWSRAAACRPAGSASMARSAAAVRGWPVPCVVGRGLESLLTNLDTWQSNF